MKCRIPSVLFLIIAGVLIGPNGIGAVTLETFGEALSTIVGVAVALIVFDGAFQLQLGRLQETRRTILRLITVGAVVSFLGTALIVRVLRGANWDLALLVATGPTVITPIMAYVPVREEVALTLASEGIVNDVSAVILATILFKAMSVAHLSTFSALQSFAARLLTGIIVGTVVAGMVWLMLTHVTLSPDAGARPARLAVVAGAILSFALADAIFAEAGIAAAATAGALLGYLDLPNQHAIVDFQNDLAVLVLSIVFIMLAALLDLGEVIGLGLAESA